MSPLCNVSHAARPVHLAATVLALGSLACSNGTTTAGCDICTTSATVSGTVRDTLGAPTQGAVVGVAILGDSCVGPTIGSTSTENAPGPTDATGGYRYVLRSPRAPFTGCARAMAVLLTDTSMVADTIAAGSLLRFRDDYPPGGPHDSLTLDLVLRHR